MSGFTGHVRSQEPSLRQLDVLRFIAQHSAERGYPPTLREICTAIGIGSTNATAQHIDALQRKGLVTRTPMTSRGLVITAAGREFIESAAQPEAAASAEGGS